MSFDGSELWRRVDMLFWRAKLRSVREQLDAGKIGEAAAQFLHSQLHEFRSGPELAGQLAHKLMARAQASAFRSDFMSAWQDLALAQRLTEAAGGRDSGHVLRQRQELVELAIETASGHLSAGRPLQVLRIVSDLKRRHVLDSRADQLETLAKRVQQAEHWATQGEWTKAQTELDQVLALRPDLSWVQSRRQALVQQTAMAGGLAHRLQTAIQESRWSTARKVSTQLLDIAPHWQIAADALRQSVKRQQPPQVAARTPSADVSLHETSGGAPAESDTNFSSSPKRMPMKRYMLWVDGVGGYLLCADSQVTIGRALPDAGIEIPVLGDLRRRHLRISRTGGDFVATPLSNVFADGQAVSGPHLMQNGQRLTLGGSVVIEFQRPHPLSSSARLNIVSRHRTQPWSDAIILLADTLILGPGASSHIVCPEMEDELILCRGAKGWTGRCEGNIEVAGKVHTSQSDLPEGCRISGEGFSLTLEAV